MVITYYGEGAFRVQNGDLSLLIDPPNNRLKADVILRTSASTDYFPRGPEEMVFPGEYEVKGIEITGFSLNQESNDKEIKTAYQIKWDEVRLVFFGGITKIPEAQILESFDEVDVLFVPTGGGKVLGAKDAAYIVKQLEPKVAIPSFYKGAPELAKALGQNGGEKLIEKFVFKVKDLTGQSGRVIALKAAGG